MSDNRKVMLVANPVSGKKAVSNALSDICRVFLELGWIPSVFVTGGRGDATDYVKKYGGDFGRIVAIGGDGTMNETVTGIIEAGLDTPFAFIPSGTTNDFASTHHLPADMIEASRLAAGGKIRMLDACRFNERYFMFHCGCGFFAGVVNDTYQEMKNALGYFAYILEGMSNALSIAPKHAVFNIDGKSFEEDFIYLGLLSTLSLGGNITTLPADVVRADDGRFEVFLAKAPGDIFELGEELKEFTGKNFNGEYISLFKMEKCTIDSETELEWSLDGEPYLGSDKKHVEIEVLPRRISFVSSDGDETLS
ncbi:MAG: YegS/Rv2252/BmrU family lipid kinase [Oscillospiraceae bacterium]|nr:YegS/Rv2252/BmrU family lipid kinase [Oscillospiraceae bacterium]